MALKTVGDVVGYIDDLVATQQAGAALGSVAAAGAVPGR